MNVNPCCQGRGTPYAEAKALHPSEQNPENWFRLECATEPAQVHEFEPEAKRLNMPC